MNAVQFIRSLGHAVPMSAERPCTPMSNSEIRRHMQQGAILFNGEQVDPNEEIDFPIISLVFFPRGKRKTTLY